MIRRPPRSTLFPTRRSSDLAARVARGQSVTEINTHGSQVVDTWAFNAEDLGEWMSMEHSRAYYMRDRKSTRLNSSHANISYAVFCLKYNIYYSGYRWRLFRD